MIHVVFHRPEPPNKGLQPTSAVGRRAVARLPLALAAEPQAVRRTKETQMTPQRLNELSCPNCKQASWMLDSDFRGMDGVMLPYAQRVYSCRCCSNTGPGWRLMQQSPPEFLPQPHDMYPMTHAEFDHWVAILKASFPEHPRLADLGRGFVPRVPTAVIVRLWNRMTGQ